MHLANTITMRQYDGIKYTDDLSDARYLAHLLRLGILPEGYIYPKAVFRGQYTHFKQHLSETMRAVDGDEVALAVGQVEAGGSLPGW